MQVFLDDLEKMGIFAELDSDDPQKVRRQFEQLIHDGQLTFRSGLRGAYYVKFYNEPTEFRVKPGAFLYDPEAGVSHNVDVE